MLINAHLKRATALALALSAATAGPAAARFELNPPPGTPAKSTQAAPSTISPQALGLMNKYRYAAAPAQVASTTEHGLAATPQGVFGVPRSEVASGPRVVRLPSGSAFDWGDAGIGAAGGLVLALIAIGGGLAVSQRGRGNVPGPAVTA